MAFFAIDIGQDWFWFDLFVYLMFASPFLIGLVLLGVLCALISVLQRRRQRRLFSVKPRGDNALIRPGVPNKGNGVGTNPVRHNSCSFREPFASGGPSNLGQLNGSRPTLSFCR
jgi:hypothetical protein